MVPRSGVIVAVVVVALSAVMADGWNKDKAATPIQTETWRPRARRRTSRLGENGKPLLKLEDFDHAMRGGMGRQVDVAQMNLDVRSGMDVDALFARYRDTMGASARDFPNVTFIHVTVPLNTDALEWAKAGNVARERFNALIRGEYAGHHLFDIAAIESTKPDGTRVSGSYDNQGYFALYDGYASDVRGPPQRGWCQDRGDSLSRRDRAGIAEVDTAGQPF
jgi:hypothetical protein